MLCLWHSEIDSLSILSLCICKRVQCCILAGFGFDLKNTQIKKILKNSSQEKLQMLQNSVMINQWN